MIAESQHALCRELSSGCRAAAVATIAAACNASRAGRRGTAAATANGRRRPLEGVNLALERLCVPSAPGGTKAAGAAGCSDHQSKVKATIEASLNQF